jgi:hypothetical protein
MARPFKKDLTPIGKGGVTKHKGKGASEQRRSRGGGESLTGGDQFARAMGRYPKSAPTPAAPTPVAGLTPPFGIGVPPEEV